MHDALSHASNDLVSLAKRSLIKEGDILVYKRTFRPPGCTIEKDLLVRSPLPQCERDFDTQFLCRSDL